MFSCAVAAMHSTHPPVQVDSGRQLPGDGDQLQAKAGGGDGVARGDCQPLLHHRDLVCEGDPERNQAKH